MEMRKPISGLQKSAHVLLRAFPVARDAPTKLDYPRGCGEEPPSQKRPGAADAVIESGQDPPIAISNTP